MYTADNPTRRCEAYTAAPSTLNFLALPAWPTIAVVLLVDVLGKRLAAASALLQTSSDLAVRGSAATTVTMRAESANGLTSAQGIRLTERSWRPQNAAERLSCWRRLSSVHAISSSAHPTVLRYQGCGAPSGRLSIGLG